MNCHQCGHEIKKSDDYCHFCGTKKSKTDSSISSHFSQFNGTGLKNTVFGWLYSSLQLWKKNPVYFLGIGLIIMGIILIPGLNVLAALLSGAILGVVFSSVQMIDNDEVPTIAKLQSFLKDMWIYLVLIQLIVILLVSFATIFFWIPAFFVAAFFLYVIPAAIQDPVSISTIFEKSYDLARIDYWSVLVAVLILTFINAIAFLVFPLFLCATIPYSVCVIHISYKDLNDFPAKMTQMPPAVISR